MNQTCETETDTVMEIERLELQARDLRRRTDTAKTDPDRRVLGRQLKEVEQRIDNLRARLRWPIQQT
jgi:hypothetical protein